MDKPLVKVTWIDASDPPGDASWHSEADLDKFQEQVVRVVSVGYLRSKTKLYITLVADYIENADGTITWGRPTKIPIGMVEKEDTL